MDTLMLDTPYIQTDMDNTEFGAYSYHKNENISRPIDMDVADVQCKHCATRNRKKSRTSCMKSKGNQDPKPSC